MKKVLEVIHLDVYYGKAQILFDVGFTVNQGETVSLIGRNGVGKTTLLKAIMNIAVTKKGKILLNGADITNLPTHAIASKAVAYVPDYTGLIPGVSVYDNLRLAVGRKNIDITQAEEIYPEIRGLLNRRADSLSGGERKITALLRALLMNPTLLLVDEPTEGVSPIMATRIYGILDRMKKSGLTVLVVEQGTRFNVLSKIADRFMVMVGGKIVWESTTERVSEEIEQIKRFLAVGA
ncbi:MAG: ATP-binding cassette domain-containing protein [Candidatus Caldarchaeum sp.]|nr:ATP-binding cassette domain-containing protein [Candidatus Caldarchaeum sp.]MCS7134224.1 ATP-binding cassette domain-containing protein [Candidatus Caldarchaeum sp.]MCX8201745.1 ATP-binding cassette domain-containing protein [Candidatus Caldarchaeum sp.]MDW8063020.1 ATP-binding cassette domain-containing protein [Candidatus Caldarchaeum sp.]MDW8435624.1 ATP-binding cassette domain-containing protein [Candidatus Caldarchaeum sp.]